MFRPVYRFVSSARPEAALRVAVLAGVAVCAAVAARAERQPYERYKTIVDRQMFGPPPDGFDPTKRPEEAKGDREAQKAAQELTKEQEKIRSAIRFSMINVTPSGETAVGFTDSSDAKNPKNYYLKVGETRGGWTVKEADPVASSMTIVKGEIEVSLTIGGDSGKGAGKTASRANGPAAGRSPEPAGAGFGSLRARRNKLRAAETARQEAFNRQMQEREAAFERRQQEAQRAQEEEKAERAAEKAREEAEREAQRKQLLQIQEELKRAREEKSRENREEPTDE